MQNDEHGVRAALVIASFGYEDPGLRQLTAPTRDAQSLADVLGNPVLGGFAVDVLNDLPSYKVSQSIEKFFARRKRDDLLLLYFSGHGVKDENGELYFAAVDTQLGLLRSTAIPANFVTNVMLQSRSRRQVLLLDCCYSGAFARGMATKSDQQIGIREFFSGNGRVVLTASDAMQYAFEEDAAVEGTAIQSIFTRTLVDGLRTGSADADGDGIITIDELYDYAYEQVAEKTPHQRPGKWAFGVEGDLVIARSPASTVRVVPLPAELQQAIDSPLARVREGAVHELGKFLQGSNKALAHAARAALARLTEDDSRLVSKAAEESLGGAGVSPAPIKQASPIASTPAPAPVEQPVAAFASRRPGFLQGVVVPALIVGAAWSVIWSAVWTTMLGGTVFYNALGYLLAGFVMGCAIGLVMAFVLKRSILFRSRKQIALVSLAWGAALALVFPFLHMRPSLSLTVGTTVASVATALVVRRSGVPLKSMDFLVIGIGAVSIWLLEFIASILGVSIYTRWGITTTAVATTLSSGVLFWRVRARS